MPRNTYEMKRTNSICPNPEDQLLELVKNNEVFKIRDLLNQHPNLVDKTYDSPFYKPILAIACSDLANQINSQTFEILLSKDANPLAPCEIHQGKTPLHFASIAHNEKALKAICECIKLKNLDINTTAEGDTALVSLIKETEDATTPAVNCVRLLVKAGIDINKSDLNDRSAVLHAARKSQTEIIKVLIQETNLDIDSHYLRKKNARALILEKSLLKESDLPLLLENLEAQDNNNVCDNLKESAFKLLKQRKQDDFVCLNLFDADVVDKDDGNETMLQICARLDLYNAAKFLVGLHADVNRITEKCTKLPVEISAELGYFRTFCELVSSDTAVIGAGVLSLLLSHIDGPVTDQMNHRKCFEILLEKRQIYNVLNCKNEDGNTPLHYAARYSDVDTTLLLLNKGASLADMNNYGFLPIEDVDAEILHEHLNHCIKCNTTNTNKIDDGDFTVTFDYKTLLPSEKQSKIDNSELTHVNSHSNSKDHAKIPLKTNYSEEIDSKMLYSSEMTIIKYIADNKELRPLLLHPVITSFIYLKWHRISAMFYANLVLYIMVWCSLTTYIFMEYNNDQENQYKGFTIVLSVIIHASFVILLIKELFQFVVSPIKYLRQIENWVELTLVVTMVLLLFLKDVDVNGKKQISAVAILVSAFQLVLLVGQHPKMSTSIVMLRTVSFSFFKFFLWYAILILAFALSFFTLFNTSNVPQNATAVENFTAGAVGSKSGAVDNGTGAVGPQSTEGADGEKQDAFGNAGVSLFKTFVMLTGEFDASDIEFDAFPITSRLLFVVFIFMIAIVLFNLLNGLAVSDTQQIKNNAELFAYKSRIDHICYVENMLLGNMAFVPDCCFKYLHNLCCLFPFFNVNVTLPGRLAKRALLFPHYLKNLELEVLLNKNGRVKFPVEKEKSRVFIDKKTVKNVRSLLKERNRTNANDLTLCKLLARVEELEKNQSSIESKLDIILNRLT